MGLRGKWAFAGTSKNLSRARALLHALKGGEGGAGEPLGRAKRGRTGEGSKAVAVAVDSVERDLGDSRNILLIWCVSYNQGM